MDKQHKNLWKKLLAVAAFVAIASQADAQVAIGSAGYVGENFGCTVGEVAVGEDCGLWADAVKVSSGIEGVYADGDVQLSNNANGTLDITIPQELIASGAFYCIYDLSGRMLRQEQISCNPTHVDYTGMNSQVVIITVNSAKAGRISTFKIVK